MIDLVSRRYLFILISLLVIIPGVIAILAGGIKPGIDFTGGTRWEVKVSNAEANHTEDFKRVLATVDYKDAVVKSATIGEAPNITNTIIMDLPGQIQDEEKAKIEAALVNNKLVAGQLVSETVSIPGEVAPAGTVTATGTITGTIAGTVTVPATSTVKSAPSVTATTAAGTITATGTITGSPTISATGTTTATLPAFQTKIIERTRIKPSEEIGFTSVGPVIGSELLVRAFYAIGAASLVILIYLTIVFRAVPNAFRYGVCAIVALLHDVLVVVGVFAILGLLFSVEIDALFVTAMLTVIGFSVHDTIVVFDRVRENIGKRRFERFEEVVNYSLVQTLARSINTSVTVLLTLFALYLFGGATIRNFVLALLIGILSGTYSSIFNASMLLVIWENREWTRWFGRGQEAPTSSRTAATR